MAFAGTTIYGMASLIERLPPAAADHGADGFVGAEIVGAIDIEQRREFRAGAVDAALDGADRAAADRRGVFVGEAGGADQDQRFTLVLRKLFERRAEFLEFEMGVLRRLGLQGLGIAAVGSARSADSGGRLGLLL